MNKNQFSIAICAVALIAVVLVLSACGSTSAQPTAQPQVTGQSVTPAPGVDGATLLQERCTVCHTLDRIKQAKKTREQWTLTITKMLSNGAKLNDAERTVLLDYLTKTYGP